MPLRTVVCIVVLVLGAAENAGAQFRARVHASGFSAPLAFVQDPTQANVQFVVQQSGLIRVVRDGAVLANPFIDLSGSISCCGERGLLGLAFAPDYAATRRFYVNYTNPEGHTVVARGKRSAANAVVAEPTVVPMVWSSIGNIGHIPHVPSYGNHNGGDLAFGTDGYLYIGMGDGGSGNDPQHHAQNPKELLGKMLRIDVSVADSDPNGYRVPVDNPFVDGAPISALPEIWAFGLRNPWRFSFDKGEGGTGALIVADVGQGSYEEINYEPKGAGGRNYGWRNREGAHVNVTDLPPAYVPLSDPVFEYDHSDGRSISGGFVYRGARLGPALRALRFRRFCQRPGVVGRTDSRCPR